MWPWGHAAVGYLLYSLVARWRYQHVPQGYAVWGLALGTQFPDLIDKPLAWIQVVPEGRALAHSLLVALPLCAGVLWLRRAESSHVPFAFVLGYGSHLLADSWRALVTLRFDRLTYLLWPVLAPPDYGKERFLDHWVALQQSLQSIDPLTILGGAAHAVVYQLLLTILITGLWLADGHPGIWLPAALRRTR